VSDHNDLAGIQGGTTDEYYHTTADENAAIAGAATPSSTNVFATMADVGSTDFATTAEVSGVHTTGSVTSGATAMTVASATGIVAGMMVVGEGITPGTTVSVIDGTDVTLSANAGITLSADPVGFYDVTKALSPGLVAGMLCRAWIFFNGTGTIDILASMNVSSISDSGTGNYRINFTSAMPHANYVVTGTAATTGARGYYVGPGMHARTTTQISVYLQNDAGTASDADQVNIAVFC
jgi:hypothetical protein